MTARDIWMERPVIFADFTIREGDWMHEGFEVGPIEGSYRLLSLSLRYADSNERVFPDSAPMWDLPYRYRAVLSRLSAKAAFACGMTNDDPENPAPPPANGHDANAAAPSPSS
jgi:hypothetical protein